MFAVARPAARRLSGIARSMASGPLKVGDKLPDGVFQEGTPGTKVAMAALFKGKKVAFFGVPGAYTPGCSKTHLPGFVDNAAALKSKGVQEVVCMAVNDAFVMDAWGKAQGADGKVRMLADPDGSITKSLGFQVDLTAALGNVRCRRFSMIVDDGVIKVLNLEDGGAMTCSLAPDLLKQL